jgi:hypothetical protein
MSLAVTFNGMRVTRLSLWVPWRGVWCADCDLDLDNLSQTPQSGQPVSLVIGSQTLTGNIDDQNAGSWVAKASARVVGGNGNWNNPVPALDFNAGGGISSTQVYAATAASVGEPAPLDPNPQGWARFPRTQGPASRVFLDRDWYVDPITGVATVSGWPSAQLDPNAIITDFSPADMSAEIISTGALVFPGTILSDPRFNGASYIVRDSETLITGKNIKTTVWLSPNPVSRLQSAIYQLAREATQSVYLASYQYRFVLPAAGDYSKISLQAITPGAPDLNPISQWAGLAGLAAKIAPGTIVVVAFTADNPPLPFIVSYSNLTTPLEVDIAGGSNFLVPAPWALALFTALETFSGALAALPAGPLSAVAAAGVALQTALGTLPPSATLLTKAT